MHPVGTFVEKDRAALAALIDEIGFGLVVACGPAGPVAAHAPVILTGERLRFHLGAANPVTAALSAMDKTALVVVTGPDTYISPDWYGVPDQVPTWNYVSAEIEGTARPTATAATIQLLDDLAARFESALAPKPPWTRAKLDPRRFDAMVAAIVGFEVTVSRLEGVRKLSQNKSSAQMLSVADHLANAAGEGARAIGRLIRAEAAHFPPPPPPVRGPPPPQAGED